MKIRVATRGSALSIRQTEIVCNKIKELSPDVSFEYVIVTTKGDVIQDRPIREIGIKGVFEKEVNVAVLKGEADMAVHSLKDVPTEVSEDLILAGVFGRESPYDVIISRDGSDLSNIKSESIIGTSSIRRKAMILNYRPDLMVKDLRGNVDTRVRKLLDGLYDAIVVAEVGIKRLGLNVDYKVIDPHVITPAPSQGFIGVYCRRDDAELVKLLSEASDKDAYVECMVERYITRRIEGGCHVPFGCLATKIGDRLRVLATLASRDGREKVQVEREGDASKPYELAEAVAGELIRAKDRLRLSVR